MFGESARAERGRRPRVVYWGTQPSPYVVDRFNAVADADRIHLEAWFDQLREADRSWSVDPGTWRFESRVLSPLGRRHLPVQELRAVRPDLIVQAFDRPNFALGFLAARVTAGRTAFRVLPTFESWAPRTRFGELSKHFLFRSVDAAKVPGPAGQLEAQRYGLPAIRCSPVTQAIDLRRYSEGRRIGVDERQARRRALGLSGTVFLYVGRLWSGKGLEHLIRAFDSAQRLDPEMSLLIVGNGVDEGQYRDQARDNPRIVFAGHVQPASLPGWYGICDALVFPTLGDPNGLVVEEAMAAGLPVISTTSAGDIRLRVTPGINGFLVPPADSEQLAARMTDFAGDPALQVKMRAGAIDHASRYDLERYADDFEAFVRSALATPRRHTPASFVSTLLGLAIVSTARGQAEPLRPAAAVEVRRSLAE